MPGTAEGPRGPDRRPRRRLTAPWHVYARNLGVFGLGLAAVGGWANGLVDELGDNTAVAALAEGQDRQAYEQECRFDIAQPVAELDSAQIDVLVDLAIARGAGDTAALREGLDRLAEIRRDKQTAIERRADAVAECNDRARALFGPEP